MYIRPSKRLTMVGLVAAFATGALVARVLYVLGCKVESTAEGCDEVCVTALAIRRLQPSASEERAQELARVFVEAGHESDVDPLLLVAIAMRESSLHPAVEALSRRGSLGELGLCQIHPLGPALRLRPAECPATLEGASCQVRTGARWLAFVGERGGGSTWVAVAAYGRRRCPSEAEARADRNAAIAASLYARVGGSF